MMGNAFYPDEWLDSAYDIPYEQFYQKGMRGIIFDIDNTLINTTGAAGAARCPGGRAGSTAV